MERIFLRAHDSETHALAESKFKGHPLAQFADHPLVVCRRHNLYRELV